MMNGMMNDEWIKQTEQKRERREDISQLVSQSESSELVIQSVSVNSI